MAVIFSNDVIKTKESKWNINHKKHYQKCQSCQFKFIKVSSWNTKKNLEKSYVSDTMFHAIILSAMSRKFAKKCFSYFTLEISDCIFVSEFNILSHRVFIANINYLILIGLVNIWSIPINFIIELQSIHSHIIFSQI